MVLESFLMLLLVSEKVLDFSTMLFLYLVYDFAVSVDDLGFVAFEEFDDEGYSKQASQKHDEPEA
ncbi:hypothetical protein HRbin03_00380 [archaeon HR03]|nr:hypothetical protein HRbin03_00380 [archaeon HR03]